MSKSIPIERLTVGTVIHAVGSDFGAFGSFATVTAIEDQGEGEAFLVTVDHGGWLGEQTMAVAKGGRVQFGGVGQPKLLSLDECSDEALLARIAADGVENAAMIQEQNERAQLFGAVARALGVPALSVAAE
jgi:hypothetical protein